MATPVEILIADDHALFRKGFGILLRDALPGVGIKEVAGFDAALDLLASSPQMTGAFLDLMMPGEDGIALTRSLREDLATPESWSSPTSTRAAIEAMPAGCIAVVDAMGVTDAGIFGDILCARMKQRGVAGLVTDGVVRDVAGVLGTTLPVWCQGGAAPPSVAGLTFVGWQQPIACGGVAVFPDDVLVVDDDGAVLIPAALVDTLVEQGPEQERMEAWIMREVDKGASLPGLYPMNAETKARYEKEKG
ncbi:MAG: response regulator [Rhodospirillales bacterium]|nr:response regulator [Rhodospirillales bacterium]